MKKRTLRERKAAFKEAYRSELIKQGILDAPEEVIENEEVALETMTKKELIDLAEGMGVSLNEKQTKAEMIEAIKFFNEVSNAVESEVVVLDEPATEENVFVEETPVVEESTEEEITEEEVQAVAEAIVEQAEEQNKTIEEVVTDIVEESKE